MGQARVITCLILLTGSRKLRDRVIVRRALHAAVESWGVDPSEVGVVHGGAYGLDRIGAYEAAAMGMLVARPMIPEWDHCGPDCPPGPHRKPKPGRPGETYCPLAGVRRNQAMVDRVVAFLNAGPGRRAVCLAFPMGRSTGTRDCARRAKAAGIHVELCIGAHQVQGQPRLAHQSHSR